MTDHNELTPSPELLTLSPELLTRWKNDWLNGIEDADELLVNAYAAGALAGADQELKACCEWLDWNHSDLLSRELRAARRPKSPSLKEQALDDLHISFDRGYLKKEAADTIRRALEQLDD